MAQLIIDVVAMLVLGGLIGAILSRFFVRVKNVKPAKVSNRKKPTIFQRTQKPQIIVIPPVPGVVTYNSQGQLLRDFVPVDLLRRVNRRSLQVRPEVVDVDFEVT